MDSGGGATESFLEIFLNNQNPEYPNFIDVYVSEIKPSLCRTFIDELSTFLSSYEGFNDTSGKPSLTHLRRVRRRTLAIKSCKQSQSTNDDTSKNVSSNMVKLEVLLTSVQFLDQILTLTEQARADWNSMVAKYDLRVVKRVVPGRSAISQEEMKEWRSRQNDLEDELVDGTPSKQITWWPTLFFPERTQEYLLSKLELSSDDIQYMRDGMIEAINDSKNHKGISFHNHIPGAVVVCPSTKCVVASSFQERNLQLDTLHSLNHGIDMDLLQVNPLCTPILLAIQGVSRRERCSIVMVNDETDDLTGQYLCTGFDLFTTNEPSIFEAMALVHARIRRVVFGSSNKLDGGLGGTGLNHAIHSLPGTNHHYRAFQCNPKLASDLHSLCEGLKTS